ncbi:MAG: ABC transporter permease [Verrucomicrobia bacterium]|nr:ABC transporter permease [Verrucomicrobiota bacterium]
MPGSFLLALRFIAYYRSRTMLLVACVTLNLFLPGAVHLLVKRFQESSSARAQATPLIIGAKGSRFGLAIHALSFQGDPVDSVTMAEVLGVRESGLAEPIPLLVRFHARGHVIVGTTPEYFVFRGLNILRGRELQRIGDCVLGSKVAERLRLKSGDRLQTDSENVFDIAGPAPLNLRVAGVLVSANSEDDYAVFVDIKTAWILEGIGHGHDDAEISENGSTLAGTHKHNASRVNLNAHSEVTESNAGAFHFHGDKNTFPVTAIIALPADAKSEVLIMGRYLSPDARAQVLKPSEVLDELMRIVFKAQRLFDLGAMMLGCVTALLVALVMALSLRLRKRERETMFKLGCSRFIIIWLQALELSIVVVASIGLASVLIWLTSLVSPAWIRGWIA